ncbi:DUF1016 N-terminal domain-containing protein [Ramlibacter sp.]|uniref:DUF1016 N-terminal domain-containing protein n=1 Tax=Ramlibacter sp. TaxID=1917967 RepID=UPI0035AF0A2E
MGIAEERPRRRLAQEQVNSVSATCGKQILVTVSRELTAEYGAGFSDTELNRTIRFAEAFPVEAIDVTSGSGASPSVTAPCKSFPARSDAADVLTLSPRRRMVIGWKTSPCGKKPSPSTSGPRRASAT